MARGLAAAFGKALHQFVMSLANTVTAKSKTYAVPPMLQVSAVYDLKFALKIMLPFAAVTVKPIQMPVLPMAMVLARHR